MAVRTITVHFRKGNVDFPRPLSYVTQGPRNTKGIQYMHKGEKTTVERWNTATVTDLGRKKCLLSIRPQCLYQEAIEAKDSTALVMHWNFMPSLKLYRWSSSKTTPGWESMGQYNNAVCQWAAFLFYESGVSMPLAMREQSLHRGKKVSISSIPPYVKGTFVLLPWPPGQVTVEPPHHSRSKSQE